MTYPYSVQYLDDDSQQEIYEPKADPHYMEVDEEVMYVAALVPEIEYLTWEEALELAMERDRDSAISLEASILEARGGA